VVRKLSGASAVVWLVFAVGGTLTAQERTRFWVTDQTNAYYLFLLTGNDSEVQLERLSEENAFHKLLTLPASATLTVVGTEIDLAPIVKERVENQGHTVLMIGKPSRNPGAMEACVALRKMCIVLSQRFPKRATEFKRRLDDAESRIRLNMGIQAIATKRLFACNGPLEALR